MTKPLADISQELYTGAHPSVPNDVKPFWHTLSNLLVFDAAVQAAPGHFLFTKKLSANAVVGMIEAELSVPGAAIGNRSKYLFWGTNSSLFRRDGITGLTTDVSRAAGGAYGVGASTEQNDQHLAHRWSFTQWGEWIFATNGFDIPQILKNTDTPPAKFANLVQTGPVALPFVEAEIIRRISVFLVALNLGAVAAYGTDYYAWSDEDDPFIWTPTTANSAGSNLLRHLNSQIMAAEYLGAGLGIYGRDQLHLAQYVGPPYIIGAEKILDGVGAWGKDAVCRIGSIHYGWGPKGIFSTDGTQVQYFDSPSIRDEIEKNLNYAQSSKIVAMPLIQYDAVMFFYPRGTSLWNNAAFAISIPTRTIWPQNYGRQAMSPGAVFDFAITGTEDGDIYMVSDEAQQSVEEESGLLTLAEVISAEVGVGELGVGEFSPGGYWEGP